MRILHVVSTLDVGGAEVHLLSQVRGQVARGHSVRVAYLLGQGTLVEEFHGAGAEWVGSVGRGLAAPWRLRPHARWAEIVHSHLLRADFLTAPAVLLSGRRRRWVSGKHNDERALLSPLVSRLHGVVGNLPARTIVLSDHVGRFTAEHGRVRPDALRRVYYGIDPEPFARAAAMDAEERAALRAELGFAPQHVVFVCVARFAPQKAHDVLLAAFERARERAPDARLLLVGGDPFGDGRERTEALARSLGLSEGGRVVFAGIRRDVPRLCGAADVFVMSSLWEGLGLVFLEAMAARLPVLATDVSAVPEVVRDGETGRLVPARDAHALAAGMVELAGDPELRARLGRRGAEVVEETFGLDRMVDETLAVYRELLEGA